MKYMYLRVGGLKKLKKESLCTVFVIVRVVPLPLCFCFFFTVFTVMFLPFFQSILQLQHTIQDSIKCTSLEIGLC